MSADFFGRRFLAALSFLTIFPVSEREEDVASSMVYFPLVGFLLGCLLWVCAHAFEEVFSSAVTALFIVSILTIVTRGRPLDGLAATLDGLGRGRDAGDIRAIMREDQRGSFGVMALVLAILTKYLLISHLIEAGSFYSLLFFPTLGMWSMVCLAWFFSASQEEGLGGYPLSRDFWWATGITLLCSIITQGLVGLGIMVLVWIFTYGVGHYVVRRIGGITTYVMGASVELVEILSLTALVALLGGSS
jgi:adenosylcobinamide-GDP ribazoletransferase